MSNEYEFKEEENKIIDRFAKSLYLLSLLLIVGGISNIIDGFTRTDVYWEIIFTGATWVAMGFVFYLPTDNLQKIVVTEGSDIKELLRSFYELKKGWYAVIFLLVINRLYNLILLIQAM